MKTNYEDKLMTFITCLFLWFKIQKMNKNAEII